MPSGNTFVEYTATTGATEFQYTFPTLNLDHVIANVDGAETDQNSGSGHTFTISETPTKRVIFDTAPGNGKTVRIYRNTMGLDNDSTDPLVDFVDGSIITADNLDDAVRQSLYIAQEKADFQTDLADAANGAVLVYNSTTSKWEVLPLNLQYDSTNGTFGFGGTPASDYAHKFVGDFLVRQDGTTNGAVLTVENTDPTNTNAVLILASYSPVVQFYDTNGSTDKKYFNIQHQDGTITFQPLTDAGAAKSTIPLKLVEDGGVLMPDLPTSDPSVTGKIWTRNGVLVLSGNDLDLDALDDTNLSSPTNNDVLTHNGTEWVNNQLDLNDLDEISLSARSALQILEHDGTNWVNRDRYIYDSGWVTTWGGVDFTTTSGKEKGTITLSATEGGYFPFNVKIYGRSSNESYQITQFETATSLHTAGAQVHYNTSTRVLSIEFQENAVRAWEDGSGVLTIPWSSLDDVRIVIT